MKLGWLFACAGCLSQPRPRPAPPADCWSDSPTLVAAFDGTNDDAQPWLSDDLSQLWYGVAWVPGDDDVYYAASSGQQWGTPLAAGFDNGQLQDDPFFDPARATMWFSSNRATGTVNQIWEMVQMPGTTTQFYMQSVHTELGARATGSMGPALTADALTIYFSDDGMTVSRATRSSLSNAVFDTPVRLAYPHPIDSPSVTSDGATLYFTDHSYTPPRIGHGHVVGNEIVDDGVVGTFQIDDASPYQDPAISGDGNTLAFAMLSSVTNHLGIFSVTRCAAINR